MEVALYEKDQGPFSRPQGYSIGLKDTAGLGVLTRLGLRPQLTGRRVAPVRQFIITNQRGKVLLSASSPLKAGKAVYRVERSYLKQLLLEAIADIPVYYGKEFRGYRQQGPKPEAFFADSSSVQGDWLVGADGIHSCLRSQLLGDQPQYLGLTSIYGTTPSPIDHPLLEEAIWICLGKDGSSFLSYNQPADGGVLFSYSLPAAHPNALQGLSQREFSQRELLQLVKQGKGEWHGLTAQVLAATQVETLGTRPFYNCTPATTIRKDRVWLIGDAAHPMSPFQGEAANTGILDTEELANFLLAVHPGSHYPEQQAQRLEAAILKRGRKAVLQSREAALEFHRKGPWEQRWRNLVLHAIHVLIQLGQPFR